MYIIFPSYSVILFFICLWLDITRPPDKIVKKCKSFWEDDKCLLINGAITPLDSQARYFGLSIISLYTVNPIFGLNIISQYNIWRCPWYNCYRRRKWTRWLEFKSWTRLIAFHIALIPLGKVWIKIFSSQLWVNSRTDWVLQPWWGD